ncbi:C-C motif chemokine 5 [Anas platyrhynchos]|uniref:C-C motif chemokine 5 n=1 Tax=Anas platyrhynchos TaxID=8839 RepID=UPI003AF23B27
MLSTRPVLLLLLLLTFSQHCATALYTPTECCFDYAQKPVRIANIKSFYTTPNDCALPAVVFVTAAGFKVCNNPQKPWVKKTLNKLRRKK